MKEKSGPQYISSPGTTLQKVETSFHVWTRLVSIRILMQEIFITWQVKQEGQKIEYFTMCTSLASIGSGIRLVSFNIPLI